RATARPQRACSSCVQASPLTLRYAKSNRRVGRSQDSYKTKTRLSRPRAGPRSGERTRVLELVELVGRRLEVLIQVEARRQEDPVLAAAQELRQATLALPERHPPVVELRVHDRDGVEPAHPELVETLRALARERALARLVRVDRAEEEEPMDVERASL